MAREIVVEMDGRPSTFAFKKVDRRKLYGVRQRVPLDTEGAACGKGELLADGSLLLRAGMTAQAYFDDEGTWYARRDLASVWPDGTVAEKHPSTLGEKQPLSKVGAEALLDARIHSVYALEPTDLDEPLRAALEAGELFQFPFSYRGGARRDVSFLVHNEHGFFGLVGQPTNPAWCDLEAVAVDDFGDDGGFDDDLDFEMF